MAHALRLTSRPYGDIHLFLRVLWFKLSQSFCSGRPWGQTVCANMQHTGKRLQTIPETNSTDDQGPGCPSLPHAPSVPGFILSFPALSYPLPRVSLLSPHPPTVMTH